jgi:septum formation protein
MKPIVLASNSPHRKELLENIGLVFTAESTEAEEILDEHLPPRELAKSLSLHKARAAAAGHPGSLIIAADTFGVLGRQLLGKPADAVQARQMLKRMSGRKHTVITGYTVLDADTGRLITEAVETNVYFRRLTDNEIGAYVATGEPLDKAGAYAVQGLGALLVEKIEGDYHNVVGLPLAALAISLKEFGVDLLSRNSG